MIMMTMMMMMMMMMMLRTRTIAHARCSAPRITVKMAFNNPYPKWLCPSEVDMVQINDVVYTRWENLKMFFVMWPPFLVTLTVYGCGGVSDTILSYLHVCCHWISGGIAIIAKLVDKKFNTEFSYNRVVAPTYSEKNRRVKQSGVGKSTTPTKFGITAEFCEISAAVFGGIATVIHISVYSRSEMRIGLYESCRRTRLRAG